MTDTASAGASGAVTGGPRALLRLEGLALFIGMTLLYYIWDGDWWVYALLFFVPDLSFAAYLSGPRFGALIYNAAHSYLAPMAMMTTGADRADSKDPQAYLKSSQPRGEQKRDPAGPARPARLAIGQRRHRRPQRGGRHRRLARLASRRRLPGSRAGGRRRPLGRRHARHPR